MILIFITVFFRISLLTFLLDSATCIGCSEAYKFPVIVSLPVYKTDHYQWAAQRKLISFADTNLGTGNVFSTCRLLPLYLATAWICFVSHCGSESRKYLTQIRIGHLHHQLRLSSWNTLHSLLQIHDHIWKLQELLSIGKGWTRSVSSLWPVIQPRKLWYILQSLYTHFHVTWITNFNYKSLILTHHESSTAVYDFKRLPLCVMLSE